MIRALSDKNKENLANLHLLLIRATESGLLDFLAADCGYNSINQFCDAVSNAMDEQQISRIWRENA